MPRRSRSSASSGTCPPGQSRHQQQRYSSREWSSHGLTPSPPSPSQGAPSLRLSRGSRGPSPVSGDGPPGVCLPQHPGSSARPPVDRRRPGASLRGSSARPPVDRRRPGASLRGAPAPGAAPPPGAPWTFALLVSGVLVGSALLGFPVLANAVGMMLQIAFFAFFARHLAFAVVALDSAPADLAAPVIDTGWQPPVSVLVACKNEESVVETLVESLLALEYPADRLQLIVVDDGSSDRTGELLDEVAATNPRLACLHRSPGAGGGKSGALNAALPEVTGRIIVIFDADHKPRADVLRRLIRHFEDPAVAAVQGRCEISNPNHSPLARLIAVDYLAGYLVNEYGRQALFGLPAYGGANCAVRASTLRELGGWNPRSVTEDTDLTLRVHLAGWRVRYDVTAVDAEEAVGTVSRDWRQRHRWARGHQQAGRGHPPGRGARPHPPRPQKGERAQCPPAVPLSP